MLDNVIQKSHKNHSATLYQIDYFCDISQLYKLYFIQGKMEYIYGLSIVRYIIDSTYLLMTYRAGDWSILFRNRWFLCGWPFLLNSKLCVWFLINLKFELLYFKYNMFKICVDSFWLEYMNLHPFRSLQIVTYNSNRRYNVYWQLGKDVLD